MRDRFSSIAGKLTLWIAAAMTLSGCTRACPLCSPTSCPGWQPGSCAPSPCHGYFPTCWRLWDPHCPPCPAPNLLAVEALPQPGLPPVLNSMEIAPPRPMSEKGPSPSDAPNGANQGSQPNQGANWPSAPAPWPRLPPVFTSAQLENH
jgi:hypothetical protein